MIRVTYLIPCRPLILDPLECIRVREETDGYGRQFEVKTRLDEAESVHLL